MAEISSSPTKSSSSLFLQQSSHQSSLFTATTSTTNTQNSVTIDDTIVHIKEEKDDEEVDHKLQALRDDASSSSSSTTTKPTDNNCETKANIFLQLSEESTRLQQEDSGGGERLVDNGECSSSRFSNHSDILSSEDDRIRTNSFKSEPADEEEELQGECSMTEELNSQQSCNKSQIVVPAVNGKLSPHTTEMKEVLLENEVNKKTDETIGKMNQIRSLRMSMDTHFTVPTTHTMFQRSLSYVGTSEQKLQTKKLEKEVNRDSCPKLFSLLNKTHVNGKLPPFLQEDHSNDSITSNSSSQNLVIDLGQKKKKAGKKKPMSSVNLKSRAKRKRSSSSEMPPPIDKTNPLNLSLVPFVAPIPEPVIPTPPPPPPPSAPPPSPPKPQQQQQPKPPAAVLGAPPKDPSPVKEPPAKRRVFRCSTCSTYYESWNLFLHMKEIHQKHICLYCLRLFPTAEKLSIHLEMKHDLEQNHFETQEKFLKSSRQSSFVMCCTCEHMFSEQNAFIEHSCPDFMKPCSFCDQKGRHSANCKTIKTKPRPAKIKVNGATTTPLPALPPPHLEPTPPPPQPRLAALPPPPPSKEIFKPVDLFSYNRIPKEHEFPNQLTKEEEQAKEAALIVPKLKLRIPKEFQKSVDSETSSSESGEDEEEEEPEQPPPTIQDDSNSQSMQSFAELQRIQEEIEKTKQDIEKTKLAILPTPPPSQESRQPNSPQNDDFDTSVEETKELEPPPPEPVLQAPPNEVEPPPSVQNNSDVDIESCEPVIENKPSDGILVADGHTRLIQMVLEKPLDKHDLIDLLRSCLKVSYHSCLYCNHGRRIAVNGNSLALHMLANHRFQATVDSITEEELKPETIVAKIKSGLEDINDWYFNMESYCNKALEGKPNTPEPRTFECFQCRVQTGVHKELYLHNRKMHLRTAISCFMCKANFFSYSEILCHICPGSPERMNIYDIKYRCFICELDDIPSAFRLMVHLRKKHFSCDVCLEDCKDQFRLSSHVWKHKLHHLCYRCGIAYRNKQDITKHLFWKHGTESIICKRCLQKRWRHVYHFCIPPAAFACDVCNLTFSKAIYLKVHKRIHNEELKYPCKSEGCEEKFISKKLLMKHAVLHGHEDIKTLPSIEGLTDAKPSEEGFKTEEPEVKSDPSEENPEDKKPESEDTKQPLDDGVKEEKVEEGGEKSASQIPAPPGERKRKKRTRTKEIVEDWNLQAPNLSESGSSDESDDEQPTSPKDLLLTAKTEEEAKDRISPVIVDPVPVDEAKEDEEEMPEKPQPDETGKVMDIWENFKSFQQSQNNGKLLNLSEDEDDIPTPLLHVTQSDHDYAMIYKIQRKAETIYTELQKANEEEQKRKNALSSESDSSSDSDSSCSCGSNCSCSSSGSSSSSSSDDSDSENEQKKKKKLEEHPHIATEEQTIAEEIPLPKPETIIHESDLDTTESDTDEDFYDEHPQKSASDLLAEKRKVLMERNSTSPSRAMDQEPELEPELAPEPNSSPMKEKKKVKKKKKDRKNSARTCGYVGNLVTSEVPLPTNDVPPAPIYQTAILQPEIDLIPPADLIQGPGVQDSIIQQPQLTLYQQQPFTPFSQRISTGSSCSDAADNVKRSKRQRRPNKFYGYTSDDEGGVPSNPSTPVGFAAMRPIAPPDLVWDKDDLPTPSKSILKIKKTPGSAPPTIGVAKKTLIKPDTNSTTKKRKSDKKQPAIPKLKIRQPTFMAAFQAAKAAAAKTGSAAVVPSANSVKPIYTSTSESESETEEKRAKIMALLPPAPITPEPPVRAIPLALLPNPDMAAIAYFKRNNIRYPIRPPAGARAPREGESVYCYCRCPYDEVSEMIACDGDSCAIEWFHFECVGIMLAPQGKWFCPECRPKYSNELYQT